MADNSTLPVSSGTEVFANKDVSGVKFPKTIPHNVAGTPLDLGAGATSAATTRVTLASDSPGVGAYGTPGLPSSSVVSTQFADLRTATTNITAADVASASTTGQNGAAIITGAPTAASFASWAVNGSALTRIQLSGTWVGTLSIEGSSDGGVGAWGTKTALVSGTGLTSTLTSVTGNGQFDVDSAGLTNVRVRCTAFTSGTVVAQANITSASGIVEALVAVPDGADITIGSKADAKDSHSDTTAISGISIWKQISFSIQAAAASLAGTITTTLAAATSGGLSRSRTIIPNNTTAIVVKASAGQVYKIRATNNSGTIAYIKLYDATSATAGSGTPVDTIMIPAASSGGAGIVDTTDVGAVHTTGIAYVVTTGIADGDTAVPPANSYIVTVFYK